ncbi:hypothetical protein GCM10023191_060340 [Actinoallomurus oryzae]|uniref:S-adenosyl methyltransferase n=1 Tax=Actinoallomurus oryzae TaxID=502180 RepID=A0ABP8QMJ2_9ACTN
MDREAVDRVAEAMPEIRQFIDIGSGLPTVGNTHEIAQEINPDARVVYVDNDPVVLAHGRALLAADDNTTVATADMHRPEEVLEHPKTRKLIDFNEPVGVLMIAMVHFLTVEERPAGMGRLRDALAPGSHLSATHGTADGKSAEAAADIEAVYATTPTPVSFRSHEEVSPACRGTFSSGRRFASVSARTSRTSVASPTKIIYCGGEVSCRRDRPPAWLGRRHSHRTAERSHDPSDRRQPTECRADVRLLPGGQGQLPGGP